MPDNLNKKVLLVGAGPMAIDYYKALASLAVDITTIGRSEQSALRFKEKTGSDLFIGGLERFLHQNKIVFDAAIVAVGMEELAPATTLLLQNGFKNILLEKPGGLNPKEIQELSVLSEEKKAKVLIAYNRRFYASTLKAKELIEQDGGVTSFHFEFTEWSHYIEPLDKKPGIKENWLLGNSSHVIDLAFFLGGKPSTMNCYASGSLSWHEKAVFTGAGKTKDDVLFSYHANWNAPGRWAVEILTEKSRYIFKPMEELQVQHKGSVAINPVQLDDTKDKSFKPGLLLQTQTFLEGNTSSFKTLKEQAEMLEIYTQIAKGN